ncbi:MAG: formyl transferase [Bradymonadaceae bacterium]
MTDPITLLAGDHDITRILYHDLDATYGVDRVILEEPVDRTTFLQRRIDRLGWTTVAGQVAFRLGAMPLLAGLADSRIQAIIERAGMDPSPIPEADLVEVDSANDVETAQALCYSEPEVVVISGTRIIDAAILNTVPAPFLNMHTGITPMYRGVHGGYWALAEGEPEACGVTIHKVDPGIDTGGIVDRATVDVTERDNFATYPYLQFEAGLPLLREAVGEAIDGGLETVDEPDGASELWSHPTIWEYAYNRIVDGVR